MPTKFN